MPVGAGAFSKRGKPSRPEHLRQCSSPGQTRPGPCPGDRTPANRNAPAGAFERRHKNFFSPGPGGGGGGPRGGRSFTVGGWLGVVEIRPGLWTPKLIVAGLV